MLINAMRPGSRSPAEIRASTDLGRFGLGLKTASLAQCRVLTVVSKQCKSIMARSWDLDYIAKVNDWLLLPGLPDDVTSDEGAIPEEFESGTLVLWTKLDRLAGGADVTDLKAKDRFFEVARHVEFHLAMTFHRFLEGQKSRMELLFNGNRIKPWDPFMQGHPATFGTPPERIGRVVVQGFVLPHKDKLTPDEFETGAGPEGWLAHQGFFVYRNERLLVPGGWLSLGKKWTRDEMHRLARIRLDLPNNSDDDWKIDIKKSVALPPPNLRDRLRGLAERVRADAREVFAHRGGRGARPASMRRAWIAVETSQGISYRVDRDHPSIKLVLDGVAPVQRQAIEDMLRVIEASVPVQRIWLDAAEAGDVAATKIHAGDPELLAALRSLYVHMLQSLRLSPQEARARLLGIEPFNQLPEAVRALPDAKELET